MVAVAFLLLQVFSSYAQTPDPYRYFRIGNPNDITTKTQPGFALMGGGKDLDPAFRWLCERSGGGDFLILRATGTDAYNSYVQGLCHVNSVATLVIPNLAAASDPFVAETISRAEAIFIAGGDQANYINFWQGTPVQTQLNAAIKKEVPIGGTSAGLAVQGEYVYSAQNDPFDGPDLTSTLALSNPFQPRVIIAHDFLNDPALKNTIMDTHFVTRDRMGRLLVFMARILDDNSLLSVKGIGIDERTAALMEPNGRATIVGSGAAYFLSLSTKAAVLKDGLPLTAQGFQVQKVLPGGGFDMRLWSGDSERYQLSIDAGVIHSTQEGGKVY
ncbi:cyanophycinase [Alloacidobacterium sp.]|uniref:cyanophycinase n=1 Tax=Alloacidobacterium sp. TaxID=2951999 RepID=UPI002D6322B0|nr:cyanophycinase [Alloacidobacterium sp.]HYK37910.1 cyanophycinase [Alloacidobacterium sp.]